MTSPPTPRPRVLFLGGHGRSGSTLIARALGAADGALCLGEVRYVWTRGLEENRRCGCGRRFRRCRFWRAVGQEAFGGWHRLDRHAPADLYRSVMRLRHLPGHLAPVGGTAFAGRLSELTALTRRVYEAVAAVSGNQLIVDSSKFPTSALLLRRVPGLDLRIVNVVREPHGMAHSWSAGRNSGGRRMSSHSPAQATLEWLGFNAATEGFRLTRTPWTLLRYEDFVTDPQRELARLLAFAGLPRRALRTAPAGHVILGVDHVIAGNPMKYRHGPEEVRADERWRTAMAARDRRLVTALAVPGLLRYHYGLPR